MLEKSSKVTAIVHVSNQFAKVIRKCPELSEAEDLISTKVNNIQDLAVHNAVHNT